MSKFENYCFVRKYAKNNAHSKKSEHFGARFSIAWCYGDELIITRIISIDRVNRFDHFIFHCAVKIQHFFT